MISVDSNRGMKTSLRLLLGMQMYGVAVVTYTTRSQRNNEFVSIF